MQEYESIYKAKNAVAAYPMTQRQASRRKREDEDEDLEER
jgi:serine/threonine/tyrosine-interacting protein